MKIRFLSSTIKNLDWRPLKDGESRFYLTLRAPLTTSLAEALLCRGLCYSEPDGNAALPKKEQIPPSPRKWSGSVGIPLEISGGDLLLGDRQFAFSTAYKFSVARDEKASESDITLYVTMIFHFDGREIMLYKFCQEKMKEPFTCVLSPAQGSFHFGKKSEGDEEGDGDGEDGEGEGEESKDEPDPPSSGSIARKGALKKMLGMEEAK